MEKFLSSKHQLSPVVISGISGRFPRSRNLKELADNLYNKVDMIDDDESRWKHFNSEVPRRFGKISGLEKFDASFFSFMDKHVATMDPQARMLLEHSYESIMDAGVSPQSLVGSRTGVFVSFMLSDSKDAFFLHKPTKEGHGMIGNANFYLANRISYVLGLCGPSITLDTACSGSAYALNIAIRSMMTGECDAALVAGSNLILSQLSTLEYGRAGTLSIVGESRPFDENASGYVRSEAICVIFLQKSKDSKRVYAEVVHTKTNNDGFKEEGSSFPSSEMQQKLMKEFYAEIDIDPSKIEYVEAHSTGTIVGDPQEANAIDNVFCKGKNREKPLIIGSVKSNVGHCEAAAGVTSIAKALLIFENRQIVPNINLTQMRTNVAAFNTNRIKIATEVEQFEGQLISINSFGIGGANAHILLKRNEKEKIDRGIPTDNLNRLLLWSGRTEKAVEEVFADICSRPLDAEFISLLQNSQVQINPANNIRGFGIFKHDEKTDRAVCVHKAIQSFHESRRPIVWVFSGMGSQWPGMVSDFMNIPKFAESIDRSHKTLMTKGINLKDIIESQDKQIFDSVLNSYVGIIAIEIALTDVLKSLGLKPDFIIGHSVGELGCAYADDCMTAEETILAAYVRGKVGIESKTINGSMAAVGLHHEKVLKMLPSDIDIACHNGISSTTVSGPAESIETFVKKLENEDIFAKIVACSGVAFHSRYITKMGEKLFEELKKVIKNPQKRSAKWLSSTYNKTLWGETESQFSSSEYHTKNLLNPVLFEEVCKMLPSNSLSIEIGPHGLLKSIMKMNLKDGIGFSLMQRGEANGSNYLMEVLGKLFTNGVVVDIAQLYPQIQFPVSRGTPMIAPILKWNHDDDHYVPYFDTFSHFSKRTLIINLSDKNFEFMKGHLIGNQVLFPAAGWIFYVWETFAMMIGEPFEKLNIVIEEIKFIRATPLVENRDIQVTIAIHRGSGKFEVTEGQSIICEGIIKAVDELSMTKINNSSSNDNQLALTEKDFYKTYHLMGNHYQGAFRDLKEICADQTKGKLLWKSNWITFIDSMLVNFIDLETKLQTVVVGLQKVVINPKVHFDLVNSKLDQIETLLDLNFCSYTKIMQAGGIELHGCKLLRHEKRRSQPATLENYKFVPYFSEQKLSKENCVRIFLQLIHENAPSKRMKVVEIIKLVEYYEDEEPLTHEIVKIASNQPGPTLEVTLLSSIIFPDMEGVEISSDDITQFTEVDVIVTKSFNEKSSSEIKSALSKTGFIICNDVKLLNQENSDFNVISKLQVGITFFFLLQLRKDLNKKFPVVEITSTVDGWLGNLKLSLDVGPTVVFSNQCTSGIIGLVNCIRKEPFGGELTCFLMMDTNAPKFSIDNQFYKTQLELGLAMNVFKDGKWGSYRHLQFFEETGLRSYKNHLYADCLFKGDLSTLSWICGPIDVSKLALNKELVSIHFAALNFRDIMFATGKIVNEKEDQVHSTIGYELSGVTNSGQRIMGFSKEGGLMSSHCLTESLIFWNVPEDWTLQQAATVPIVYATVYLAFFKLSRIKSGNTVLIHAGSGGVGQAAIQVALAYGLEVFTTVSTNEKKQFLLEKFPKLKEKNIGNSRESSFEQMIQVNTKGKGVDFVLNCLSAELLQASLRCVKKQGTFIEIGRFDIQNETKIHLGHFGKRINFQVVMLDDLDSNEEDVKFVHDLIERDLKSGVIHPINSTVFDAPNIQEAFRFMANGKHIGKILLKMREIDNEMLLVKIISRVYFNQEESVVVVGGLGGFGMELAGWLVARGCRKLVLCSRSGVTNGYQAMRIRQWKSIGTEVLVSKSDVTSKSGCEQMIDEANKLGSVAGIFNLAAVLRDRLFDSQTIEAFAEVMRPKTEVTKHLDEISRQKCSNLKHFVVFSSLACGRGNAGQSNYGTANSVIERIVEIRQQEGFPGKAIQWGAIGDVGMLAQAQADNKDMEIAGTTPQEISSCLEALDSLLTSAEPVVASMVVAKKRLLNHQKKNIVNDIMNILTTGADKSLDNEKPLGKFGIDSLTTVEIQQLLERDYGTVISSNMLRSLSIKQIKDRVDLVVPNDVMMFDASSLDDFKMMHSTFGDESLVDKVILKANEVDVDDHLPIALIIPGIFGSSADAYYALAQNLKYPTFILQLHTTAECTNFDKMVDMLKEEVLNLLKTKNFILICQSFGAPIGLKLAALLEKHDKIGNFVSIDGSQKWSFQIASQILNTSDTIDVVETWSLKFFIKIAFMSEAKEVIQQVFAEKTWDDKVETLYSRVKKRHSFSFHYLKTVLLNAVVNRTRMVLKINEIKFPLLTKTKITLLRASEAILKDIEEDYSLKKHSLQPFSNIVLEGSHVTIIANPKVPEILNNLF